MTDSSMQFDNEALESIAQRLQDAGTPLETVDPAGPLDDLEPLRGPLGDATVVGMGEASHGTREFLRFKHRLFRFLVEELDYRLFALEEDFTTTRPINEYVTEGRGDPREALLADPIVHPWKVESVLTLVEWIRSFNKGRERSDQIRFHGFDMQAGHEMKDGLVSYIQQVDESVLSEIDAIASAIDDASLYTEGDESDQQRYVEAHGEVASILEERLTANRDAYVDASSERAFERALGQTEQLAQKYRSLVAYHESTAEHGAVRDRAMAANIQWLLEYENEDQIAIWAHNSHVKRGAQPGGPAEGSPTMGEFLDQQSAIEYVPVGFSVASGEFRIHSVADEQCVSAPIAPPPAGSLPAVLSDTGEDLFALDLSSLPATGLVADWLESEPTRHSLHHVFEGDPMNYAESNPRADFDLLVFVHDGTATRGLED